MEINIPSGLVEKTREQLGEKGVEFFTYLKDLTGIVNPMQGHDVPLCRIHYKEIEIVDFLRDQPECKDWSDVEIINNWTLIVEKAIL